MKLSTDLRDGHVVVTVHADKLDAAGAIQFRRQIDDADFAAGHMTILDMSKIRFMDSSGVWALTHLCKAVDKDAPLKLVADHLPILHLLRATGIARFIEVHPTISAAIATHDVQPHASVKSAVFGRLMRPLRRFGDRDAPGSQTA